MPRQGKIYCGSGDRQREYIVTYSDDSPERSEAVEFFQQFEHGLFPAMKLHEGIESLSLDEAQRLMDQNPIQEQWKILTITDRDLVTDDDLSRFQHIPELQILKIMTNKITDRGIEHIKWLTKLEFLILYSDQVTNSCLRDIVNLTSLKFVDMQCACSVARDAYMDAMDKLPNHRSRRYPPRDTNAASRPYS